MADKKVKVNVEVNDNGSTKAVTQDTKDLNKELEKTQKLATAALKAGAEAKKAASKATSLAYDTGGSGSGANAQGARASSDNSNYRQAKGLTGSTGAEARDFARQSEGLGGLVRLYATYAANIFAASAAYAALSRAADTSNMVRGLDQLGAASGRNLGTLAKNISMVTDNAVSMREAMTAAAQATAGGMSGQNLMKLTAIAQKASLALGIAMPDALSRLTRGVIKLEPELLDEIGIMVRVDTATANYARTLGKSVTALTDFEKRQAFTNAVIEQGQQKFNEIEMASNPYAKLTASLSNLTQSGLELVNKVLGPLINGLASSPTALGVALAGIGAILTKQAIPAIGNWKKGLQEAAEESAKTASRIHADFINYQDFVKEDIKEKFAKELAPQLAAVDAARKKTMDSFAKTGLGKGTIAAKLVADPNLANEESFKKLELQAQRAMSTAAKQAQVDTDVARTAVKNATDRANAIRETITALREEQIALKARDAAVVAKGGGEVSSNRWGSEGWARQRNLQRADQNMRTSGILADVSANTQSAGMVGAWKILREEVNMARKAIEITDAASGMPRMVAGIGAVRAGLISIRGAAIIAATGVGILATAMQNAFAIIGIVIAAAMALHSWLSDNAKEAQELASSLEGLSASATTAYNVLARLAKIPLDQVVTIDSINARATAMLEMANAAEESVTKLERANAKASKTDQFFDWISQAWDGDNKTKTAKSMSESITASIAIMQEGPAKEKLKTKLTNILGGSKLDAKSTFNILENLDDAEATDKLKNISKALKEVAADENNAASRGKELKDSLAASSLAFDDVMKSLNNQSPMQKFANAIIADSGKMEKALEDPKVAFTNLVELLNNPKQMSLLGPDGIKSLQNVAPEVKKIAKELNEAEKERATLIGKIQNSKEGTERTNNENLLRQTEVRINDLRKLGGQIASKELPGLAAEQFQRGAAIISAEITAAFASAGLAIRKSLSSVFTGETKVREDAAIQQAEIGAQAALIKATYDQIKQAKLNELAIRENTAQQIINNQNSTAEEKVNAAKDINRARLVAGTISNKTALKDAANMAGKDGVAGEAGREAFQTAQSFASFEIQLAKLGGQSGAVKIQEQLGLINERVNKEIKDLEVQEKKLALQSAMIDGLKSLTDGTSVEIVRNKQALEIARENLVFDKEQLELKKKGQQLDKALSMGADSKKIQEERVKLAELQKNLDDRKGLTKDNRQLSDAKELMDVRIAALNKEKEISDSIRAANDSVDNAKLDALKNQLDVMSRIEFVDERGIVAKQRDLDIATEALRLSQEQATLDANRANSLAIIAEKRSVNENNGNDAGVAANLKQQETEINAVYNARSSALAANNALKLQGIELSAREKAMTAEMNELLKKQADIMSDVQGASSSLAKVFGEVGEGVGAALEEFTKSYQSREKLEKEHQQNMEKISSIEDPAERKQAEAKATKKYNKDIEKEELGMYGAMTKGAKAMFGEKSVLAKTFGAIEKAMHVAKLAMYAAEVAANWSTVGPTIAAEGAKNTVKGTGAILSALNAPFPINFVAGAAMALIVASLLGGGSDTKIPAGITAEEKQAVQGTGQRYVNGELVDTGGGVLGDKEAQNEDFVNSIELLQSLTVDGIQVNTSMLNALIRIEQNTRALAGQAYKVPGLTGGKSAFGTAEKSDNGIAGFFAKSTSILDTGIKAVEGATLGMENAFKQYETVQKTNSGFLGIGKSTKTNVNEKDLSKQFNEDLTSIFRDGIDAAATGLSMLGAGTKDVLTKSITDSIDLAAFEVSAKDLDGDELTDAIMATIGESISGALRGVAPFLDEFRQLGEGTYGTAVRLGGELKYVGDAFAYMGMKINFLPDTINEVSAAVQAEYDAARAARDASTAALTAAQSDPNLLPMGSGENWNNYAEMAAAQTALNDAQEASADTNERYLKAEEALNNAKYKNVVSNIRLSQALITAAGGIEAFSDQFEFYINNFMTEGERMAARIPMVISKLGDLEKAFPNLGIAAIRTRDDFVRVMQSLDPEKQAGAIAGLLQIAPDIASVTQELPDSTITYLNGLTEALDKNNEATEKAKELTDKTRELTIRIMELEGNTVGALAERRKDELAAMNEASRVLQQRVWLLEDEQKLAKAIETSERRIMELTYQSTALTEAKRAEELKGLTEAEVIRKKYIYALEDEETVKNQLIAAYNKEQSTLKTTIDRLKQATKSLAEFRDQLLIGDKSVLTPAQKYEEAKAQFAAVAALVQSTGTSDSEVEARTEAISKFPTAANAFLEASKNYFASSDQYQADFASVLALTDDTNGVLKDQLTEAEKQLANSTKMVEHLEFIKNAGQSVAELLPKFALAVDQRLQAGFAAVAAGSSAAANAPGLGSQYGINPNGGYIPIGNNNYLTPSGGGMGASWTNTNGVISITTNKGLKFTGTDLINYATQMITDGKGQIFLEEAKQQGLTMQALDALLGYSDGTTAKWAKDNFGMQAFAKGGLASAGLALVGEEGPEVVDFDTPGRVYTANQTKGMFESVAGNGNAEIVRELRELRAEVSALRKDQDKQNKEAIAANFVANDKAANDTVDGMAQAMAIANWKKANGAKLK